MDRERLESAAATYYGLRGLLMIPVGALMVIGALGNMEWGPFRHIWVFWAAALVVAAAVGILGHYYRNYGRIVPTRRTQVKAVIATVVTTALINGVLQVTWSLDLPVSGTAIAIAIALVILIQYVAGGVRLRRHQALISAALLVAGLVPVWGGVSADTRFNVGMVLAGVTIVALGILDHAALRRAFAPAVDLNHGAADVET